MRVQSSRQANPSCAKVESTPGAASKRRGEHSLPAVTQSVRPRSKAADPTGGDQTRKRLQVEPSGHRVLQRQTVGYGAKQCEQIRLDGLDYGYGILTPKHEPVSLTHGNGARVRAPLCRRQILWIR